MTQTRLTFSDLTRAIAVHFGVLMFSFSNITFFKLVLTLLGLEAQSRLLGTLLYAVLDAFLLFYYLVPLLRRRAYKPLGLWLGFNLLYFLPVLLARDPALAAQYALFVLPFSLLALALGLSFAARLEFVRAFLRLRYYFSAFALFYMINLSFFAADYRSALPHFTYGNGAWTMLPALILYSYIYVVRPASLEQGGRAIPRDLPAHLALLGLGVLFSGLRTGLIIVVLVFVLLLGFTLRELRAGRRAKAKRMGLPLVAALALLVALGLAARFLAPKGSRLSAFAKGFFYEVANHERAEKDEDEEDKERPAEEEKLRLSMSERASLKAYNVATGGEESVERIYIYYIVRSDRPKSETEARLREDILAGTGHYIRVDERARAELARFKILNDRVSLWRLALEELKRSPVLGHGPRFFVEKYEGYYPHNIVLESLTDFGLAGSALLGLALLALALQAGRALRGRREALWGTLLFFTFCYIPSYLLYEPLYMNGSLSFGLVLLTACALAGRGDEAGQPARTAGEAGP